jgi:N-acetylmuramic acid 6-phosphate (MurNAc-6-P) etherase
MMVDLRAMSRKLRERSIRTLTIVAGIDRARAARLLEEAGGSVKTASSGFVGRALGEDGA